MGYRRALIFFVLVTALVSIWFALGLGSRTAEGDPSLLLPVADFAARVETPESSGRESVALEQPESAVVHASAVTEAKAAAKDALAADDARYREKYRGFSKDQLVLADHDLERRVKCERDRITKEIHASGDLDMTVVPSGEPMPTLLQTTPGSPVAAAAFAVESRPDGTRIVRQREINATNYPEFHALQMEQCWVASEWKHLERIGK